MDNKKSTSPRQGADRAQGSFLHDFGKIFLQGVDKLGELFLQEVDKIFSLLKASPPQSLEEITTAYSDEMDQMILKIEQEHALFFRGGIFDFHYVNEKFFKITIDLFFQDQEQKWKKQSAKQSLSIKQLIPEAAEELRTKGKVSFDIDPPKGSRGAMVEDDSVSPDA